MSQDGQEIKAYGHKRAKLNPHSSTTNKQKAKSKSFAMMRQKRSIRAKSKRSFRERQVLQFETCMNAKLRWLKSTFKQCGMCAYFEVTQDWDCMDQYFGWCFITGQESLTSSILNPPFSPAFPLPHSLPLFPYTAIFCSCLQMTLHKSLIKQRRKKWLHCLLYSCWIGTYYREYWDCRREDRYHKAMSCHVSCCYKVCHPPHRFTAFTCCILTCIVIPICFLCSWYIIPFL